MTAKAMQRNPVLGKKEEMKRGEGGGGGGGGRSSSSTTTTTTWEPILLLIPYESLGLNSCHQVWPQVPLSAEPFL
ncbi:hypothetical protein I79_004576 [Cricetulus griseus]|uniref:Uncharacterized protein n=1 Tax=Cricetulus griseus TaxID=10029 RepID=G3H2X2_CRIGR|nr:hypothetical protein I79_004576 [Cricetulus griseus]